MAGRATIFPGDVIVQGNFSSGSQTLPSACVADAQVAAAAKISASKLQHQHCIRYGQKTGTDVANETQVIHNVRGLTGTVAGVLVTPDTAPTGGDKKFTVDVQKSTGGGAWASVLSAVVTVDNTSVTRTTQAGSLSGTPALAANDALRVVVAVSGSTGSQGQGFGVCVTTREDAD